VTTTSKGIYITYGKMILFNSYFISREILFKMDERPLSGLSMFSLSSQPVSLLSAGLSAAVNTSSDVLTSLSWESGSCSLLGKRNTNEDRFVKEDDLPSSITMSNIKQGFYAVYDGHTGDDAAIFLQDHLHHDIYKHPLFYEDTVKAIEETCYDTDKKFIQICHQRRKESGSTALGIFLRGSELILFNIGDSYAVLSTNGFAVSHLTVETMMHYNNIVWRFHVWFIGGNNAIS